MCILVAVQKIIVTDVMDHLVADTRMGIRRMNALKPKKRRLSWNSVRGSEGMKHKNEGRKKNYGRNLWYCSDSSVIYFWSSWACMYGSLQSRQISDRLKF